MRFLSLWNSKNGSVSPFSHLVSSFDNSLLVVMFGSTVSRVTRFGVQASRRIGSLVSAQGAKKSQLAYALAIGAAGAASIYLVHKQLNAEEVEGGFLYTW